MTPQEKLKRDIQTLMESIKIDVQDLQKVELSPQDRQGIRRHLKWCQDELRSLALQFGEE